ncbi:MAG: hypothetical protein CFE33_14685 [Pseudorhodobacter sp. PARRP1]|nr:MAG: hypothetical protein CFE33_14685 [Pseudorhodobacter sp. PARRP1]
MPKPLDPAANAALDAAVVKAADMPHAPADLAAQPSAGPQNRTQAAKSPAEWAYERIILYIRNFESQLDAQQEIAMGFAGNDAGVLRIEGLGFFEPDLLTFYGRDDDGMKTQLIQHVSQLSVMLRAVPKAAPEAPPTRIGFRLASGWMGGESGDGSA